MPEQGKPKKDKPAAPAEPVKPTVSDFRSLESWLLRFEKHVASQFRWLLIDHCKIRTKIDGQTVCPMLAYGYARSSNTKDDRFVPDSRNMSGAAGVHDSVASAVVHVADDITTSRYFKPELRKRLLEACKLKDPDAEEPQEA